LTGGKLNPKYVREERGGSVRILYSGIGDNATKLGGTVQGGKGKNTLTNRGGEIS